MAWVERNRCADRADLKRCIRRSRCWTGKGNDRGKVEGGGDFMVPFPWVRDFIDLNVRQGKTLRGHEAAISVRLQADRAAFQDFPAVPFETCDKRPGRVASQALIRYKNTDYSVPVAYAHRNAIGVRPYVQTGSLGGLDRMPGMLILELYRAQISKRGVETSRVVDLIDEC